MLRFKYLVAAVLLFALLLIPGKTVAQSRIAGEAVVPVRYEDMDSPIHALSHARCSQHCRKRVY